MTAERPRSTLSRRQFSAALSAGALGLALAPSARTAPPGPPARPNLVRIIADNLGRESVGTYGGRLFDTPRIDRIGTEGVVFDCCYIGTPLCSPARAGLMTGRYPGCAGVSGQPDPGRPEEGTLRLDEITLAEILRAEGYSTGMFGKWNLGYDPRFLPTNQGYDTYYGINAGHADYWKHTYDRDGKKYFYRDTEPVEPEGFVDNLCTDEALAWAAAQHAQGRPFFLDLAFFTPHGPYQPPPGYPEQGTADQHYASMIDNMDRLAGKVLDTLESLGIDENTLVLFISDQGASRMNNFKRDLTEGGLRVVCHARWPGRIRAGTRVETPIVSYDWFTTFARIAGGRIPDDRLIVGKDIAHLFEGNGWDPHDALFWTFEGEHAIRRGDWKLHLGGETVRGLYHLGDDPAAAHDLSGANPEKVRILRDELLAWRREMCAPRR